ncbi:His-Xaa-Ser system radical SAM maturase HxsB [Vibrio crassostreae]|uniref:His-Xaa-Ser system radical SAM maturase HxsB n=1 Tax=Vibrio crassostreae TaxID=246167 RepID=UPI000F46854C|nr:His-Xaa-Ser system radical SAM maturase HxsB [Vibrio crassostreae]ROR22259.1 His-Xaa-Ser system radical SAM maturase HxsB [Vibrio crassostreae]
MRFHPKEYYEESEYKLLPIRFSKLNDDQIIITNIVGEYEIVSEEELIGIINKSQSLRPELVSALHAKHMIYNGTTQVPLNMLGLKYRSKISRVKEFTSLHMVVTSLRCDYTCSYCQVSRQGITSNIEEYDMSLKTADKVIDMIFDSPSKGMKIEYQGGESLLNFDVIKYITEKSFVRAKQEGRYVDFVIATNLSLLDDTIISFCKLYNIYISTSLDGPKALHDRNRPKPEKDGYDLTVKGIKAIQDYIGVQNVTALMTTTGRSLMYGKEIVDEYVKNNMTAIFIRPLSPYGFAISKKQINQYNTNEFLDFFKETLNYILEINKAGYNLIEQYSSLILTKLLSTKDLGYVDLQSPSGALIGGIIYNYDGDVYASDESRMQAAMGNNRFKLGNVHQNSYEEIIGNDFMLDALEKSMAISSPTCSTCAFLPFCGSDPVYHYATQKNVVGQKAISGFCKKNMGVFKHLISLLESGDEETKQILNSWVKY